MPELKAKVVIPPEEKPKEVGKKIAIAMIPSILLIAILAWIRLSYTSTGG